MFYSILFYIQCHTVTVTVVTIGVITVILKITQVLKTHTKKQSQNETVEETDYEAYITVANPYQRPTVDDMVYVEVDKV